MTETTVELAFARKPPLAGPARSLVVFLHGYGADGADLLGLADSMEAYFPNTAFVAPDAPDRCSGNPFGFQWFPIPWLDGSTERAAAEGLAASSAALNRFLDERLADEDLAADSLALIGFSQGAMMAMHVAPRRNTAMAGLVAISGRLLVPERLNAEIRVRPPVLLVHGDQDPVVPFSDMGLAGRALTEAGFETYGHVMRGTGHGIAPDGLSAALTFLKDRLPT
jgi:phospholipase/carboxylesterase